MENSSDPEFKKVYEFFKLMSVCHSVVIDVDQKTGEKKFQASSPDELALVEGAARVGFKCVEKTTQYIGVQIDYVKNAKDTF